MTKEVILAFISGLGCGGIVIFKLIKDYGAEIKRINKAWLTELDNKNDYIKALENEIKRLAESEG